MMKTGFVEKQRLVFRYRRFRLKNHFFLIFEWFRSYFWYNFWLEFTLVSLELITYSANFTNSQIVLTQSSTWKQKLDTRTHLLKQQMKLMVDKKMVDFHHWTVFNEHSNSCKQVLISPLVFDDIWLFSLYRRKKVGYCGKLGVISENFLSIREKSQISWKTRGDISTCYDWNFLA